MDSSHFARGISGAVLGVFVAAASVLLFATSASGQETTRVSVDSSGAEGNGNSSYPSISSDGQVVAFESRASNLVAGDTNGASDLFVHDRTTGITERVSVDSSGAEGNSDSGSASTSSDGQIVAFVSFATNLVAGDTNASNDVFVHDRATGITERVSVDSSGAEGNAISSSPSISSDGQLVAFESMASNLVAGDTNGTLDVFLHDRTTGITERVSVNSSGAQGSSHSYDPSLSADGQLVAFTSGATNLVAGDTNKSYDVFVHNRATGITERVSIDSSGAQGNNDSFDPSLSADGQVVAIWSNATNLVGGDTNGWPDVFAHDRATGITERVSVDSSGAEGNSLSVNTSISGDGRIVGFDSDASNLVAGDTNGGVDTFIHDRTTGITNRVSVDSSGADSKCWGSDPSISADGQIVAFWSYGSELVAGDTNGFSDVFVHERCSTPASWTNFGSGFPGTNGIPSLTSQQNPSVGTTITLDLTNSYGSPTSGLLLVGFQRGSFKTSYGGQLLVVPTVIVPVSFSYGDASITGTVPDDESLCGVPFELQGIETDPGAAYGYSFSPGLELVIGS